MKQLEHLLTTAMADTLAVHWLTTLPNPNGKSHTHGADDGQVGWRTHAVVAPEGASFAAIKLYKAACGMTPSHGWGVDLFIERKCAKCEKKLGLTPSSPEYVKPKTARKPSLRSRRGM